MFLAQYRRVLARGAEGEGAEAMREVFLGVDLSGTGINVAVLYPRRDVPWRGRAPGAAAGRGAVLNRTEALMRDAAGWTVPWVGAP